MKFEDYLNLFARRLIKLRHFHNMTAKQLAREIGKGQRTSVSNLEAKTTAPSFRTLCALAQVFQVSPAIFFLSEREMEILAKAEKGEK